MSNNHTIKIEVPSEIAESTNDEPAFVILRTRAKNKRFRVFTQLNQINQELSLALAQLQSIDQEAIDKSANKRFQAQFKKKEAQALRLKEQADELVEQVYESYIYFVADWNWLDIETGEPLPKPETREAFEDELSPQQIFWLHEQIEELKTYRATEGNVKSTMP